MVVILLILILSVIMGEKKIPAKILIARRPSCLGSKSYHIS